MTFTWPCCAVAPPASRTPTASAAHALLLIRRLLVALLRGPSGRGRSTKHRILSPMSFDLVVVGGTGDLTWRKLMPALFQAFRHGKLPEGGRILAVARQEMSDDDYRAWLKKRFQE